MSNKMNLSDASRIQSTKAIGGKDMSPGGFAARAQSAGAISANAGYDGGQHAGGGGKSSGGGQGYQGGGGGKSGGIGGHGGGGKN